MGRKGFKSFVKASAKPPSDNEAEVAPAASDTAPAAPAAPVKQQVAAKPAKQQAAAAAAPPKVAAPKAADSGSGDGSGSEEGPGDGPETRGQMLQRHKREMLAHKKALQRSGKKSKDDITKATADLEKRHAAELKALDDAGSEATVAAAGGGSTAAGAAKAAAGSDAATAGGATGDAATAADPLSKYMVDLGLGGGGAGKARKPTKAQKRREKHAVRDAEREARIAAEKDALGTPERLAEEAALRALLAPLGLAIREIRADGHCMYRSLEDQLRQAAAVAGCGGASGGDGGDGDGGGEGDGDDATPSVQELRELAAEHIRSHRDQFAAFVVPEDDAEDPAAFFERYCDEIEDTAVWGSHVELTALAGALGRRITVYAVGMAPQVLGEEHGGPGLAVCFLRHALGLGDHFNSTQPLLHASAGGEGDESEAGGSGAGSE